MVEIDIDKELEEDTMFARIEVHQYERDVKIKEALTHLQAVEKRLKKLNPEPITVKAKYDAIWLEWDYELKLIWVEDGLHGGLRGGNLSLLKKYWKSADQILIGETLIKDLLEATLSRTARRI